MNKLFTLVALLMSSPLYAEDIRFTLENKRGEANYFVEDTERQLASKLLFPFHINFLSMSYNKQLPIGTLTLRGGLLASQDIQYGKDYDWKENQVTVYSSSKNTVNNYSELEIRWSNILHPTVKFTTGISHRRLNFTWSDTYQEDYVKGETSLTNIDTLKYENKFLTYDVGLKYRFDFTESTSINLGTKLKYAHVKAKDSHILREFYTIQNSHVYGYEIAIKANYNFSQYIKVFLGFSTERLVGREEAMDYYSNYSGKFASYPSKYKFEEKSLLLGLNVRI